MRYRQRKVVYSIQRKGAKVQSRKELKTIYNAAYAIFYLAAAKIDK